MLATLTAPPNVITPEEYDVQTTSTPLRFDQNPPILRFQQEQAHVEISPVVGFEGWTVGQQVPGRLWVTEAAVSFLPSNGLVGWSLPFPALTLHALTPASSSGAAHVYCQVDESRNPAMKAKAAPPAQNGHGANGNDAAEEQGLEEDDDDEFTAMREVRIYVGEEQSQALFSALSRCSALHDSLLPNGEPSSFFGFGDMADGPEYDDEYDDEEAGWEEVEGGDEHGNDNNEDQQDGAGVNGGRGGQTILRPITKLPKHYEQPGQTKQGKGKGEADGEGEVVDQMERFLNLVDWGNVVKPKGWDDGMEGEFDDAEELGSPQKR